MTDLLWKIETPTEELDRLERELIAHELANGFDFHAPCEPLSLDQIREQSIAEFSRVEPTFDSPEWLEFVKDMECDDADCSSTDFDATETKH